MIGVGTAEKSSGFDYRGANELARYSRCVWKRRYFVLGPIRIPLEPWLMREEILAMRGPIPIGGKMVRPSWSAEHERAYLERERAV
jgi:hypothetical protein